jgi:hypothetical protein
VAEDPESICAGCHAFMPMSEKPGWVGFGKVLCKECAGKYSRGENWSGETPHFAVAFLIVGLIVIGCICLIVAVSRSWTAETAAAVTALGGILWFAVAAGLHLLRRILIALENPGRTNRKG